MELKKQIGRRIKELRKNKSLTQEKFAEMIDTAQNTLSYIEAGAHFCSADTLEKIIDVLEIEPHELFEFGHFKHQNQLIEEIIEILNNNPSKVKDIYKIVKALVN